MRKSIHPDYHEVTVTCACGNTFKSGSTIKGNLLKIDICNKCHPFYTGKKKVVDSSGTVENFKRKYNLN